MTRSIPKTLGLAGDYGLAVLADGSPTSVRTDCVSGALVGQPAPAGAPGRSALSFDIATGTYTWVWKTEPSWAGTCRTFTLELDDGSVHTARVDFRR
ncbi:PxKF domain-containing protein [uncultured Pseudokineococcus sp.]|uniref:PxKF domain-containing protein n=1 Tax=uncultured Pseudokineococcus sp. TaxID=1642928 RepID=UPI00260A6275|nr:PxKF domain-containing protein [uncultured Pseudokineococcus sp.]